MTPLHDVRGPFAAVAPPAGEACPPGYQADGPGLFEVTDPGLSARSVTNVRRLAGAGRAPGSVLIAVAAWLLVAIGGAALYVSFTAQQRYVFAARHQNAASIIEALLLDLLMMVFTLLALGLSRAGKPSRTERVLILACAAASAYMNVSAADTASPRSVVAYAVAPVALAVVVDRVVAVIRRYVLGDDEVSAWTSLGRVLGAVMRLAGIVALYSLRFVLAPPETAKGLRRAVLAAAPLPVLSVPEEPQPIDPPPTKKAALLALYRQHAEYGVKASASKVAAELAAQVDLSPGTARNYVYAELESRAS